MINYLLILIVVVGTSRISINNTGDSCRFAKNYSTINFLTNPSLVDDFLRKIARWEANFIKKVGVDSLTGLTYDGIRVDVTTGEILSSTLHRFTASSK